MNLRLQPSSGRAIDPSYLVAPGTLTGAGILATGTATIGVETELNLPVLVRVFNFVLVAYFLLLWNLRATVQDNGPGSSSVQGTRVGLSNIRQRLQAVHGNRAWLEVEALANGGFAGIVVPLPDCGYAPMEFGA